MIAKVGGRIISAGIADRILIGPLDEHWHQVVLVEYPSRAAFLQMLEDPEYLAGIPHRYAGLEATRLIVTTHVG